MMPTEPASGADTGTVFNLADWSDEDLTKLPRPTAAGDGSHGRALTDALRPARRRPAH